MDSEHRDLLMKTWELIETTREEVLQLREEIELARNTVARSQKLLSRPTIRAPIDSADSAVVLKPL